MRGVFLQCYLQFYQDDVPTQLVFDQRLVQKHRSIEKFLINRANFAKDQKKSLKANCEIMLASTAEKERIYSEVNHDMRVVMGILAPFAENSEIQRNKMSELDACLADKIESLDSPTVIENDDGNYDD